MATDKQERAVAGAQLVGGCRSQAGGKYLHRYPHQLSGGQRQRVVIAGAPVLELSHPIHPYTKALLSVISVPNPRLRQERIVLQGDPPNPVDLPPGCRFHPRGPAAQTICRQ